MTTRNNTAKSALGWGGSGGCGGGGQGGAAAPGGRGRGGEQQAAAAEDLINFLTSAASQAKFVTDTHEYSLISGAAAPAGVPALDQIGAPAVDLASLKNIQATQDLLIEVGLL